MLRTITIITILLTGEFGMTFLSKMNTTTTGATYFQATPTVVIFRTWAVTWEPLITMSSWWAQWRLKSPASRLFTQALNQAQIKENIKAPRHWPLWGEFNGDRWIPAQRASNAENVSIWWRHHHRCHDYDLGMKNEVGLYFHFHIRSTRGLDGFKVLLRLRRICST